MHAQPAGALLPLFDRLSSDIATTADGRMLDGGGLQQSLQHDLERLFNVRNGLSIEQYLGDAPTSLNYGLPDTLALSAQNSGDLRRWELVVARAIALYEPRLSLVRVVVTPDRGNPTVARVSIGGAVTLGRQLCQVHFDVVLDSRAARLDLAA